MKTMIIKFLKTGYRLSGVNAANYGDIGVNAIDLSISSSTSSTKGATGTKSVAIGDHVTASGNMSFAIGEYAEATNNTSVALGYVAKATGSRSFATGDNTTASGNASSVMGNQTKSSDFGSLVIGNFNAVGNTVTSGGSASSFSTNNSAFVIGKGTNNDNRSDALIVYFNGNATLAGSLTELSDVSLKENIKTLPSQLEKINKLNRETDDNPNQGTTRIGFIAQELEKVLPGLVSTNETTGLKSVNGSSK